MRRFLIVASMMLFLAGAASAGVQARKLVLDPAGAGEGPSFRVLDERHDRLTLELNLPALDLEEFAVGNELYQTLAIPGGGIRGETGQAGLPTLSRLISVPPGARLSVRVTSTETQSFSGYRVFPVQPDEGESFVVDRDY